MLAVGIALYAFLVGIGAMGTGFKWMGKEFTTELLGGQHGPLVSLFIGILATTLVQSSSTTTSLVVGMVAAGAIELHSAIYMVMGANLGTTVTNTIVSLGHIAQSSEYRRAFAAATVHDFFNLIVLAVLFPLEVYTGFLDKIAGVMTRSFSDMGGMVLANPVKAATKPAINLLKSGVEAIGQEGPVLVVLAILITFGGLIVLVKLLKSIMVSKLENLFDRVIFKSPYRGLVFGLFLTILVQSSSITTSVAVPLVGAGVLTIQQVFPYTMGANIGTTVTALMAALAAYAGAAQGDQATAILGLSLAFHHVMFNVIGVALVWPFRRIPIAIAENFARLAQWNKAVPLVYIVLTFYLLPAAVVWLGD
ncbi:MAG: Na/Pi cotransporter family protein [Planctomycetota bacterium]|nr:MAG: Na/Pi cotransporter family protein [Planctomycetota bacterium]